MEIAAILNALEFYGEDTEGKQAAADSLGISLTTLYRKLKKYNICLT
jgi:transcriptional regulator with PAS, ATPase and Fis domain